MPNPEVGIHDDIEYEVKVKVPTRAEPLVMQVFTSRKPDVAKRHIERIVKGHNDNNDSDSMVLLGYEIKDPELRKRFAGEPSAASEAPKPVNVDTDE